MFRIFACVLVSLLSPNAVGLVSEFEILNPPYFEPYYVERTENNITVITIHDNGTQDVETLADFQRRERTVQIDGNDQNEQGKFA